MAHQGRHRLGPPSGVPRHAMPFHRWIRRARLDPPPRPAAPLAVRAYRPCRGRDEALSFRNCPQFWPAEHAESGAQWTPGIHPVIHALMHAGRIYSLRTVMAWTRRETIVFVIVSAIPTGLYAGLEQTWIGLPWLPIAMLGTAVAFITGFKNSASYDRTWEARKIWGGIINASRRWAFAILDFATISGSETGSETGSDTEDLDATKRRILHRHIAWLTALRYQLREPRMWESTKHSDLEFRRRNYAIPEDARSLSEEWANVLSPDEQARPQSAHQPCCTHSPPTVGRPSEAVPARLDRRLPPHGTPEAAGRIGRLPREV